MAINGDEGGFIPLGEAAAWTANYRLQSAGSTRAHLWGVNRIQELMADPRCVGIRAYYAIDFNGDKQLVLIGVDKEEKDIVDTGVALDQSFPCPSCCDITSPLN
jgi:hypothetical protein